MPWLLFCVIDGKVGNVRVISLVALMFLSAACDKKKVEIVDQTTGMEREDYGWQEILKAFDAFAKTDETAKDLAKLSGVIERLKPGFHQSIENDVEVLFTLAAMRVMEKYVKAPGKKIENDLALDVWPLIFSRQPKPNENARAYVASLCKEKPSLGCREYVVEAQPIRLFAQAWRKLWGRADQSVRKCAHCDEEYQKRLKHYLELEEHVAERAQEARNWGRVNSWPVVIGEANSDKRKFRIDLNEDDIYRINGEPVVGAIETSFPKAKDGDIAVHLGPNADIGRLRRLVKAAANKGHKGVYLEVRNTRFPYIRSTILVTPKHAKSSKLLDTDSVQAFATWVFKSAENS